MGHTPRPHIFSGNGTVREVTRLINVDDDIELVTVERLISYFMEGRIKPYPFTIPARVRVYPRGRPMRSLMLAARRSKNDPFFGHLNIETKMGVFTGAGRGVFRYFQFASKHALHLDHHISSMHQVPFLSMMAVIY